MRDTHRIFRTRVARELRSGVNGGLPAQTWRTGVRSILLDVTLWTLASPILLLLWLIRLVRRLRYWRILYSVALRCRTCGGTISLVGQWRCSCGYEFRGHTME